MTDVRQVWDIEQLVRWALRDQGLGWESLAPSRGQDYASLGTRVDTSRWSAPAPSAALWTDGDAMLVRQAVGALPSEASTLVLLNGRCGMRPDWCEEGPGAWVQQRDGRGRLRWDWDDPVNRTGERRPRLAFEGTRPELVGFHRAQYTLWREGLVAMVAPLNGVMASHRATEPATPELPWLRRKPVILETVEAAHGRS